MYGAAIETLGEVGKVVQSLYAKVRVSLSVMTVIAHVNVHRHVDCADRLI
jgi:hypothetical protein